MRQRHLFKRVERHPAPPAGAAFHIPRQDHAEPVLQRYRHDRAEKRGGGEMALILDELTDCVSDTDTVEQAIDRQELGRAVNAFVRGLPTAKRSIFVRRYWYADAVSTIAEDCGMRPGAVSKALERTRTQLKAYLTERGFTL